MPMTVSGPGGGRLPGNKKVLERGDVDPIKARSVSSCDGIDGTGAGAADLLVSEGYWYMVLVVLAVRGSERKCR
jgi:hypothetical protein